MPASKLNVQVIVGLVDRLTKPLQGLSGNIKRTAADMDRLLSKTANATFIGQAMADAGRGLFDPLRQAVHTAAELTGELTDVGIVANQAAAEIVAIRPELRALALEKVQPLRALTESLGAMTAKGLEWQTARSALPEVARAATAARAELKDMEGVAASLIQQLGIAPDRLADPYNRLAAAANAGGFELRDMAQYFPEVTASMAKVDTGTRAVSTLGAALQIVRKGAGSAGQAATQMGDLLEKMFAPATVDALEKKFNTDLPAALKRWRAEGKNVFDEFIALIRRVTGGDEFKIAQIYGDKEGRAALMSLLRNWQDLEKIRAAADAAPGQDLIGQMFGRRMAEDPTLRIRQLGIAVDNLSDRIGTALSPVLTPLIERLGALVDKVGAWIDKNPELATTLLMVAGVTAGLMVVFGGLITALAGIVGSLAVLWVSLKVVAGPFAALWRFGGLLVRVFGALGWVVKLLAVALWKDIATKAIPAVLAGLRLLWGALLANPVAVVIGLIAGAIYVFTHWQETIEAASRAYEWLVEQLGFDPVVVVQQKWDGLTAYLKRWFANIPAIAANAVAAMQKTGTDMIDGLWLGISERWEALKAKVAGIANSITGIFRSETDTQSPSRVFAALGADLMRGLEVGIRASERLPMAAMRSAAVGLTLGASVAAMPASASMSALTWPVPQIDTSALEAKLGRLTMPESIRWSDARPVAEPGHEQPTQARAQRSAPISMPISITINAPAGTDTQALAALVRREVQGATKAAAGRLAALYDRPDGM